MPLACVPSLFIIVSSQRNNALLNLQNQFIILDKVFYYALNKIWCQKKVLCGRCTI